MEPAPTRTTILFVKKLLPDGEPCAKCRDIEDRLHRDGLIRYVDEIVTALEDDPASPGMELAEHHGVQRAPFFVLRGSDGVEQVIESYLAFKQRFSGAEATTADLTDTVDKHPDLAFI